MPTYLTGRPLTAEEATALAALARSRTAPVRAVARARIIREAQHGARVPAIARMRGVCEATVRTWLRRFNAAGLAGLGDVPRAGRPATYPPQAVGELVAASLTAPHALGLPFGSWTLDRLAADLAEEKGIAMQRSWIGESLQAEGLRWRTQETGFGERPDPTFAAKRGPS